MKFTLGSKRPLSLAISGLLALACSDGQGPGEHSTPLPPTPFVVSSPVPAPPAASGGVVRSAPDAWTAVYVSLPTGAIPGGHAATIQDARTGSNASAAIVEGGFDPVLLVAEIGDTLAMVVQTDTGPLPYRCIVAGDRPPVVVRTSPPPHKRDVPLNARLVIVFSAPIDAATLNSGSVQLWHQTTPVTGQLAFGDPAHLTATFAPDAPLSGLTNYELRVTQGVLGLDGAPLKAPVSVPFTTQAESAAPLFTVGGTVTGLTGTGLVLLNNGADPLTVSANGTFTFATSLASGAAYSITAFAQPSGPAQSCAVTGGSGTVTSASVTTVAIVCATNGTDGILRVTVATTGPDVPATDTVAVDYGSRFATSITRANGMDSITLTPGAHRVGLVVAQNCTVTSPNFVLMTIAAGVPTDLAFSVTCVANGTARVTVATTGPDAPATYPVYVDPVGFAVDVPSNGTVSFPLALGPHSVTLPVPQNCTLTSPNNVSATVAAGATTDVAFSVTCVANGTAHVTVATTGPNAPSAYSVQVGPGPSGSAMRVSVPASGTVSFALALGTHSVTLPVPPNCTIAGTNVVSVTVAADAPAEIAFSLTCVVTPTGIIHISETTTGTNGPVVYEVFMTRIPPGSYYSYLDSTRNGTASVGVAAGRYVVDLRLPTDCTGSPYSPNVTVVSGQTTYVPFNITCGPDASVGYTVGGTVTGLAGSGLVLRDNGGDDLAVTANGPFTFPTPLANGSTYSVTVGAQPGSPGQICGVGNGQGLSYAGNITNVEIICATVPTDLVFASVTAGMQRTCGVTAAGAAYCWGTGWLGDGTTLPRSFPVAVVGGVRFASVSAGWGHTCGVTAAGAAYCWGGNESGELGDGTTTNRSTPVLVAGGLSFAAVTAATEFGSGVGYTCGVTVAGAAYCWGYNGSGQLGDGTRINRLTPVPVAGGVSFAAVTAGGALTCGITAAGDAYCWGFNGGGGLGDGTTTDRLVPVRVTGGVRFAVVTAGHAYACGVTATGAAYCWGLGGGAAGGEPNPVPVPGGVDFAAVTAAYDHTCGVTAAGAAYCWGSNLQGALGDGTSIDRLSPWPVARGLSFASVTAGADHTCGLTAAGTAYCWGTNGWGQLGDGTSIYPYYSTVPVKVAGQP